MILSIYPHSRSFAAWTRRETSLAEFAGGLTMRQFSERFRSARPELLTYSIEALGWSGYIACAPINGGFGTVEVLARMLRPQLAAWVRPFVESADVYTRFCAALRKEGISKDLCPPTLLWPYCGFGAYAGGKKTGFGRKAKALNSCSVTGWLVPRDSGLRLETLLDRVLGESGTWAFCEGDEPGTQPTAAGQAEVTWALSAPTLIAGEADDSVAARLQSVSARLSDHLARCEAGEATTFNCPYADIVRPRVDLYVNAAGWARPDAYCSAIEAIVEKRILLMRHLSWPTFYPVVQDAIDVLAEKRNDGIAAYDSIRSQLAALLATLRDRHPVLRTEGVMLGLVSSP